jgi:hypothetical protein
MSPFTINYEDPTSINKYNAIKEMYSETFESILPDILTLELKGTWPRHPVSKKGGQTADYHPSPIQHFGYLKKLFPKTQWSSNTLEFVKIEQVRMEQLRDFDDMIFKRPQLRI